MSMGGGTHVGRQVVDRDGQIGAVVEIEAAQEILVGLAVAAVLGDDQAGYDFKCFRRPGKRPRGDFLAADIFLARSRESCCPPRRATPTPIGPSFAAANRIL